MYPRITVLLIISNVLSVPWNDRISSCNSMKEKVDKLNVTYKGIGQVKDKKISTYNRKIGPIN